MSLNELREAISVEEGQISSSSARQHNNIQAIASHCQSLVQVEEEDNLLFFAHPSVKAFLMGEPIEPNLASLHIPPQEQLDVELANTCITYLHFSDFERSLVKAKPKWVPPDAIKMAKSALRTDSSRITRLANTKLFSPHKAMAKPVVGIRKQVLGIEEDSKPLDINAGYPFLKYASMHWLSHSADLAHWDNPIWRLWEQLILTPRDHVRIPWDSWDIVDDNTPSDVLDWVFTHSDLTLLAYIIKKHRFLPPSTKLSIYPGADSPEGSDLVRILSSTVLDSPRSISIHIMEALYQAVESDNLTVTKQITSHPDRLLQEFTSQGREYNVLSLSVARGCKDIVEAVLQCYFSLFAINSETPYYLEIKSKSTANALFNNPSGDSDFEILGRVEAELMEEYCDALLMIQLLNEIFDFYQPAFKSSDTCLRMLFALENALNNTIARIARTFPQPQLLNDDAALLCGHILTGLQECRRGVTDFLGGSSVMIFHRQYGDRKLMHPEYGFQDEDVWPSEKSGLTYLEMVEEVVSKGNIKSNLREADIRSTTNEGDRRSTVYEAEFFPKYIVKLLEQDLTSSPLEHLEVIIVLIKAMTHVEARLSPEDKQEPQEDPLMNAILVAFRVIHHSERYAVKPLRREGEQFESKGREVAIIPKREQIYNEI